jgi:hypothetical protein
MLRVTSAVALLLILAVPLRAAEEAKPNTLTQKEVEEGWILLFDGETTFGWQSKDLDKWRASDGTLGPNAESAKPLVTTCQWSSYSLSIEYKTKEAHVKVRLGCDKEGNNCRISHGLRSDDGWHKFEMEGPDNPREGYIALSGDRSLVRNIKLKPHDTKPLFNGKDLTGWKKFDADPKRAKSEFNVTKEGWIHLKDGPGDLQTEKEWGDFILQIECFSNGDKLNSGVFFRCRPNEYQNGYEAQIHNGFTEKPEKEYTIEEYDPETHKLTGTKKEKFQAMDYGTGGIYRRMPARRAVAKDKEWFTMTVAAQGRHIATWVNGIQVVDWTDQRPEADNARNGYKPGKGPISLQGHDATTDLRFRNINIVELPAREVKKDK